MSDWNEWITVDSVLAGEKQMDSEKETDKKLWEWVTFMKMSAARIAGHVRYTWIGRKTEKYTSQQETRERKTETKNTYKKRDAQADWAADSLSSCHSDVRARLELWVVSALTFLLPSVTVRGTGMGGHLLRFGGGFSLFHRIMIWSIKQTQTDDLDWLEIVDAIQNSVYSYAVSNYV